MFNTSTFKTAFDFKKRAKAALNSNPNLIAENYKQLAPEFKKLQLHNQKIRTLWELGYQSKALRVIEVHENLTHEGLKCKFMPYTGDLLPFGVKTTSKPSKMDREAYEAEFTRIFGNSEIPANRMDPLP